MNIINIIAKGENKNTEFKSQTPSSEKIAKTLIAFANGSGGKLIIGVTDDKDIIGFDGDLQNEMDKVSNIVHDLIHPALLPEIYSYNVDGKILLIIEVFPSQIKPHYIKSIGKLDGTFIRVGATNKKADIEYIQELERQRLNISYDEDICIDDSIKIDSKELLQTLTENLGKSITVNDLTNLKLIKTANYKSSYTNSAPIILGLFEHVRIKCARFKGDNMDIFIDQKEFTGDLFSQLENTMNFLLTHINLEGKVGDDFITRIDEYEIPPEALREVVINAIIHRNYNMSGSDIKVAVFDSKIEITSPGAFPKGITVDDVVSGRSEIRNKVIVRLFKEAKKIEQWGRGVQRSIRLCTDRGLKSPEIIESGLFVKFVFYRESDTNQKAEAKTDTNQKAEAKTNANQKAEANKSLKDSISQILEYIQENEYITASAAENLLHLKKTRVNKILNIMIEQDLITKTGASRSTKYILKRG